LKVLTLGSKDVTVSIILPSAGLLTQNRTLVTVGGVDDVMSAASDEQQEPIY
jgi:hypothetical protein